MSRGKGARVRVFKGLAISKARGRMYFYAWRGGPRLSADPRIDENAAREFFDARAGLKALPKSTVVAALIAQYRQSPDFGGKSAKWRAEKERFLDLIVEEFGEDDIAVFDDARTRRDVIDFRDAMRETPRKADHVIGELSTFLNWSKNRGLIANNIAERVEKIGVVNRSHIIWTDDEIERTCASAPIDVERGIRLAAMTGLARADLLKLLWSEIAENSIQTTRSKTGQLVTIPLFAPLRALLATIPRRGPTVLTTSKARQWTLDGFACGVRRAATKAKVKKRLHDLRGTAATFFYANGMTDEDAAEILGWSPAHVRGIARRYVNRDELAKARVIRLDANAKRTKAP